MKGIAKDAYPEVDFQGFKEFEEHERRAGHCYFDASQNTQTTYTNGQETGKTVEINIKLGISLNQHFLLDKLGMDKLFSSENTYILTEKERSQCESTGDKNKYPELVAEHTALTSEIKSVIENSSEKNKQTDTDNSKIIQEKKQELEGKKEQLNELLKEEEETKKELEEKIKLEAELTGKVKDAEEKLQFGELISVLNRESSKDLTSLANAYQKVVKTSPLYTIAKKSFADNDQFNKKNASNNKEYLDNIYNGLLYYISCKLSKLETTCPKCKTKKNEMMPEYPDDWEKWKNDKEKQEYQHKLTSGQKDLNDKLNNQEPAPRAKETTN
ncbi:97_t:CDS:2 [Entrophospora sp. SA101]|nr:97_t:CDS:2 [Entrophospora sp. SA101]